MSNRGYSNKFCFFWFTHYVGLNFTIPSDYDAYDLMVYILSKVDLKKRWDDCGSILDDFANTALKIDLAKDPYYQFWRDPKISEAAKNIVSKITIYTKLSCEISCIL